MVNVFKKCLQSIVKFESNLNLALEAEGVANILLKWINLYIKSKFENLFVDEFTLF